MTENGEKCEILPWLKGEKIDEAIPQLMKLTAQTKKEYAFTYDPKTRIVTSVTFVGDSENCHIPLDLFATEKGVFHTHPPIDKECFPSVNDVANGIRRGLLLKGAEEMIGCPGAGLTQTWNYPANLANLTTISLLDLLDDNLTVAELDTSLSMAKLIRTKCKLPPDCLPEEFEMIEEFEGALELLTGELETKTMDLMDDLEG